LRDDRVFEKLNNKLRLLCVALKHFEKLRKVIRFFLSSLMC